MLRHTILYFLIRAGNGLIGIAFVALFSRLLSPEEYGRYSLGIAVATVASAVGFQWLNVSVGRFYAAHKETPEVIKSAALRGYWIAFGIIAILFSISIPLWNIYHVGFLFMIPLLLIAVTQGRYDMYLQVANAQHLPLQYGKLAWAKNVSMLSIGAILVYYGFGATGLLFGVFIGLLISVLIYNPMKNIVLVKDNHTTKELSRQLFTYGFPLSLTFLSIAIVDLSDRFFIGWLLGAASVAPYAASYDLIQLSVGALMNILSISLFPHIVTAMEAKKYENLHAHLTKLNGLLVVTTLGVIIGVSMLANDIAALMFGEQHREDARNIMPLIAIAIAIATYKSYYLDIVFHLTKNTLKQTQIAAIMAICNIGLNLFLIPIFGIIGAAWATILSFGIGAILSFMFGRKLFLLPILPLLDLLKIFFSTFLLISFLYLSSEYIGIFVMIFKIILAISLYLFSFWVMNYQNIRSNWRYI